MENLQQVAERVKEANNILVTVSANPSVDQLAACIALTLALNKMGKHATAVFSGQVPSTIEFLQPEMTLEKNTDSLRDFIISLDKSKADKLRYKVEDKVVKIFITPYRTSINDKDLEFSQGDFNVDVVLALGVHNQADLDQAITAHGRILHDATVVTVNIKPGGELGSINWLDAAASSLSELAVQLVNALDKNLVDSQIATAMLTGIVAETERFSNGKTSPRTMTLSAELMTAGANQQLVATKLQQPVTPVVPAPSIAEATHDHEAPIEPVQKTDDGTLEIAHEDKEDKKVAAPAPVPAPLLEPEPEKPVEQAPVLVPAPQLEPAPAPLPTLTPAVDLPAPQPAFESMINPMVEPEPAPWTPPQVHIDEHGALSPLDTLPPVDADKELPSISHHDDAPKMVVNPPSMGGQLTANTSADSYDEAAPFGMPDSDEQEMGIPEEDVPSGQSDDAASAAAPFLLGDTPAGPAPAPDLIVPTAAPAEAPAPEPAAPQIPPMAASPPNSLPEPVVETSEPGDTLADIERSVHSTHLDLQPPATPAPVAPAPDPVQQPAWTPPVQSPQLPALDPVPPVVDAFTGAPTLTDATSSPAPMTDQQAADDHLQHARDAVTEAMNAAHGTTDSPLPPIQALNAQPVDLSLGDAPAAPAPAPDPYASPTDLPGADPMTQVQQPWGPTPIPEPAAMPPVPGFGLPQPVGAQPAADDSTAPPPVPPPMMPPSNPYSQPY